MEISFIRKREGGKRNLLIIDKNIIAEKTKKEKLDKQNKQRAKENQYTIQTQILNQPTLCCPFCEYTGIIPEQFRSEPCLICPKYQARNGCEGMNNENQIFYLDETGTLIY